MTYVSTRHNPIFEDTDCVVLGHVVALVTGAKWAEDRVEALGVGKFGKARGTSPKTRGRNGKTMGNRGEILKNMFTQLETPGKKYGKTISGYLENGGYDRPKSGFEHQ